MKALAVDVARNLEQPIREMDLPVNVETRTGDTPQSRRQRQMLNPPDILMTTPEQVALLIASDHAEGLFADLSVIMSWTSFMRLRPPSAARSCRSDLRGSCNWRRTAGVSDCPPPSPIRMLCAPF